MGSASSSSKQAAIKNAEKHINSKDGYREPLKESVASKNNGILECATDRVQNNAADSCQPVYVKRKKCLQCPVFLHALPNITIVPPTLLPSKENTGLVYPSSNTTAGTTLIPLLDGISNITQTLCSSGEERPMKTHSKKKEEICSINNMGVSLIFVDKTNDTHCRTFNIADVSNLLNIVDHDKYAQKYGVCYLLKYIVIDDGKIDGMESIYNPLKKNQTTLKCGRGFNLHNNSFLLNSGVKDATDITSVSSSLYNASARESFVENETPKRNEIGSEVDLCDRSFTSTVKVLDEANVVEHEVHEPVLAVPPNMVVKSVLVQESTIKDREPISSTTLLRRRSSRMLKKHALEEKTLLAPKRTHSRYSVFNDSALYEAHVTIGLIANVATSHSSNTNGNKVKSLRVLCKSTVHVDDPLIRPGKAKKVKYGRNILCNDHSVWCFIEVKNHFCTEGKESIGNDNINNNNNNNNNNYNNCNNANILSAKTDSDISAWKNQRHKSKKKKNKSRSNSISRKNSMKHSHNNDSFSNSNDSTSTISSNNSSCGKNCKNSENTSFISWEDALFDHVTSSQNEWLMKSYNTVKHTIDIKEESNWIEIYMVLAPGATVTICEGEVRALFMRVEQIPFNEKISLAKWGKYYNEAEINVKKENIRKLFNLESKLPRNSKKRKLNTHTLLYVNATKEENNNDNNKESSNKCDVSRIEEETVNIMKENADKEKKEIISIVDEISKESTLPTVELGKFEEIPYCPSANQFKEKEEEQEQYEHEEEKEELRLNEWEPKEKLEQDEHSSEYEQQEEKEQKEEEKEQKEEYEEKEELYDEQKQELNQLVILDGKVSDFSEDVDEIFIAFNEDMTANYNEYVDEEHGAMNINNTIIKEIENKDGNKYTSFENDELDNITSPVNEVDITHRIQTPLEVPELKLSELWSSPDLLQEDNDTYKELESKNKHDEPFEPNIKLEQQHEQREQQQQQQQQQETLSSKTSRLMHLARTSKDQRYSSANIIDDFINSFDSSNEQCSLEKEKRTQHMPFRNKMSRANGTVEQYNNCNNKRMPVRMTKKKSNKCIKNLSHFIDDTYEGTSIVF